MKMMSKYNIAKAQNPQGGEHCFKLDRQTVRQCRDGNYQIILSKIISKLN
jgi:hypothetical protein